MKSTKGFVMITMLIFLTLSASIVLENLAEAKLLQKSLNYKGILGIYN